MLGGEEARHPFGRPTVRAFWSRTLACNCLFGDMAYRSHVIAWAPQVSVTEHELERGMLAEHDNPSCPFEYPDNTGGGLRGRRSESGQRFSAPSGDDTSRGASVSCAPSWSTRQRQRAFLWSLWTRGTRPAPVPRAGPWTRRTDRRGTSSDACRVASLGLPTASPRQTSRRGPESTGPS
jgi:hypothetical protein